MNTVNELKKIIEFVGGMKTKMVNAAENYKLPIPRVKALYIESVNEVLHGKKVKLTTPQEIELAVNHFNGDDYRQVWFHFVEKCQNQVKGEGGARKGQITRLENQAKEIVERDLRRLRIRIGKLKVQLRVAKGADKKEVQEKIKKYEDFIEYAQSARALNHFVNKVKLNKGITSFIFKAANWDNVVNI